MLMSEKFVKYYRLMIIEVLGLIVLGAFVRAMDAGLACPDWPLCFGDVIPDFQVQVYLEFIHRALAGFIALVCVVLNFKIIRNNNISSAIKNICWFSWGVLAAQIIMGALTVTLQLNEYVVALHLTLAMVFLLSLLWIYFYISSIHKVKLSTKVLQAPKLAKIVFSSLFIQIVIGGLVASHYAGLVCTSFPLCQGRLVPTLKGIMGLQVIHRLWAYVVTVLVLCFVFYIKKHKKELAQVLKESHWLAILIVVQVIIGICNILFYLPPLLTITHSLFAALLLIVSWKITYSLSGPKN